MELLDLVLSGCTVVVWHRCMRFGRRGKKGVRELRGFGVRG